MAFWNAKSRVNTLVLDLGSSSVAGGLVSREITQGKSPAAPPVLYYTLRLPVEQRADESVDDALLRTLDLLTDQILKEGAPTLHRETGTGHLHQIIVSMGAPWQMTSVSTETIQDDKPFTFTHALLAEAVERLGKAGPGRFDAGHGVIATLLNGYELQNPFGKHAKRADIVVLASSIEETITHRVEEAIRKAFHSHAISFTAFAPLCYSVFRQLYPHEKEFLILDVSGHRVDFALVERGYLIDTSTCARGTQELIRAGLAAERMTSVGAARSLHPFIDPERNARFGSQVAEVEHKWIEEVRASLAEIAARHALPRTIFLLANSDARSYLSRIFDAPEFHSLWLSDEPLGIVPMLPSALASFVPARALAENDLYLSLLALYSARAFGKEPEQPA